MSTTLIRNIRKMDGLSKLEFVKRVKAAIGSDTLNPALNFIEQTESISEMYVDSNIVPNLRNCFTFQIVPDDEIKQRNAWAERRIKFQAANEWFETLTEEQKEFVFLLGTASAS